jgi:trimeric autotransporter adhesin
MITFLSNQKFTVQNTSAKSRNVFSVKKFVVTALVMLCSVYNMVAQVDVTASAGAAAGTYTTLKIAIDSINSGYHQGAVAITFTPGGSETAPATGIIINGSGMTTAAGQTSSYTSLSITGPYTINAGVGTATPASLITDGILGLNGADNVTISGLTLVDGNLANPTTMEWGIGMFRPSATNGCQNNTITGNTITMKLVNFVAGVLPNFDGSVGILGTYASKDSTTKAHTGYTASGTNSNNTISSNTISFCQQGIGFIGNPSASIGNSM